MELDRIDRAILRALSVSGRMSNRELADHVGLSASPCWQRVRRLEAEGVITGYSADLDMDAMGVGEIAVIEVTLERHDDEILEVFGQAMARMPEVLEVYLTTGDYDYLLKVSVSGTRGYERFLREKLYKVPGLRHSRTSFALKCLKYSRAYVP